MVRRYRVEHTDTPHSLGLLRSRRKRPRHGRAAEKRDAIAPVYHVEHRPSYAVGLPHAQAGTNWAESPVVVAAGGYSPIDSERFRSTPRDLPLLPRQPERAVKGLLNFPSFTVTRPVGNWLS